MSALPVNSNALSSPPTKMSRRTWTWDLPLFTKELIELSVRPRTYQIRGGYAVFLLLISFIVLCWMVPSYSGSPLNVFGVGATVLAVIQYLQSCGLYIILPVLACGTLTVEKERKTLELLLITRLGPGTIILEKFLSRFVPALNFVLVSSPILAFCYALGGIELGDLRGLVQGQLLTAVHLTAVGVMCSAAFRTTSRALVGTYLCLWLINFLEFMGVWLIERWFGINLSAVILGSSNAVIPISADPTLQVSAGVLIFLNCALSLSVSGICLIIGRQFLVATCYGSTAGVLGWLRFRKRDSLVRRPRDPKDIPVDDPIAWRERPRAAYLVQWWIIRICGIIAACILLFVISRRGGPNTADLISMYFIWAATWLILTLKICISASSQIVQERTQQTLEVLLTTPLTGEQIVRQKMESVGRIIQFGRLALVGCVVLHTFYRWDISFLVNAALMIWLYPQVIAWQAMVCGLPLKNSAWAILKTLLVLAARCLVPYLLIMVLVILFSGMLMSSRNGPPDIIFVLLCLSPLTLLSMADQLSTMEGVEHFAIIGPFTTLAANGILLLYLQYKAILRADKLMGRMTPPEPFGEGDRPS